MMQYARNSPTSVVLQPIQIATGEVSRVQGVNYNQGSRPISSTHNPASLRSYKSYSPSSISTLSSPELPGLCVRGILTVNRPHSLAQQNALPTDFPPTQMPGSPDSSTSPCSVGTASWSPQYHHYPSSAHGSTMIIPQDRYICSMCTKAFSRPSSLRIHSHSHTGEKPYRCSSKGCGKAFSVRSNMKRHERGCHIDAKRGSYQAARGKDFLNGGRELLPASV